MSTIPNPQSEIINPKSEIRNRLVRPGLALALVILAIALASSNLVTQAAPAAGEVILISFGDTAPPAGNWNQIDFNSRNTTVSNLIDFNTGTATGVSYTGSGWTVGLCCSDEVWTAGDKDWVADDAADDGFSVQNWTLEKRA